MPTQNQLMTVALQYWLMLLLVLVLHFLEFCAVHKQLQLTETEYLIKNRDKTTDGILVEMEGSHAEKNSMSMQVVEGQLDHHRGMHICILVTTCSNVHVLFSFACFTLMC